MPNSKSQAWIKLKQLVGKPTLSYQRSTVNQIISELYRLEQQAIIERAYQLQNQQDNAIVEFTNESTRKQLTSELMIWYADNKEILKNTETIKEIVLSIYEDGQLISQQTVKNNKEAIEQGISFILTDAGISYEEDTSNITLVISTSQLVPQLRPGQQLFREGEFNCFIHPIIVDQQAKYEQFKDKVQIVTKKLKNGIKQYTQPNKTAETALKMIKYLTTMEQKHLESGVCEDDIQEISNKINSSFIIRNILNYVNINIHPTRKVAKYKYQYINTATNHVDEYYCVNQRQQLILSPEEFKDKVIELQDKTYSYDLYKCNISQIHFQGYTYIQSEVQRMRIIISEFNQQHPELYNRYNNQQFKFLQQFMMSNSNIKTQPIKQSELAKLVHIDQQCAYSNFHVSKYYLGFPNLTDIRKVPNSYEFTQKYIGLYICKVNFSNVPQQVIWIYQEIIYEEYHRLSSPEIKMLHEIGCDIDIYEGSYGQTSIDFRFPKEMCDEINIYDTDIRPFTKLTGSWLITEDDISAKHIHTPDDRLLQYSGMDDSHQILRLNQTEYKIKIYKNKKTHKSGISTAIYILAYQRLNILEQLMMIDPSKVRRIVTDAVYTVQQDCQLKSSFRLDKKQKLNFKPNDRYLIRLHPEVIHTQAEYKESGNFELHHGLGGSGKTHEQLKQDSGLINILYVAPSNKLCSKKREEYSKRQPTSKFNNYAVVYQDKDTKIDSLTKYGFRNIILDEISLITDKTILNIRDQYPNARLICCGDECQLESYIKSEISPFALDYDYKKEYLFSYRCKDEQLRNLQAKIREMRLLGVAEKHQLEFVKQYIKNINITQMQKDYDINDMILVSQKETRKQINEIIKQKGLLQKKYRVNKTIKYQDKKLYNGDLIITDENIQNERIIEQYAQTTHSIQGETFYDQIYLINDWMDWCPGFVYTLITRAQYLNQLVFVNYQRPQNIKLLAK